MAVPQQRSKHSSRSTLKTSAIAGALVGCIAVYVQSGVGLFHSPDFALATRPVFEWVAWGSWLALGLSMAILIYRCRREVSIRWVACAFLLFVAIDLLNYELDIYHLYPRHPWISTLLAIAGSMAALVFILGLPVFMRRLSLTMRDAARTSESESRLVAAAESSTDSVFMFDSVRDASGEISDFKFTFLNRNGAQMIGIDREGAIGRNLYEVFPALRDTARFEIYRQVVNTGEPALLDLTHSLFKSLGKPARLHLRVVKLHDGIAMTISDVSPLLQSQEELKRALSFNKSVIDSSPLGMIVTDRVGHITSVNPAAERMLWYQERDLLGESSIVLHDQREIDERALELSSQFGIEVYPDHHVFRLTPEKGLADEREWTYIRKDGSRIPVQLVVSALRDSDEAITGYLAISYDLTERKRADEYIHHVAHHDPLTGLPTRTLLRDRLEVAIERARRSQDTLAVVMIDLDNFKRINDSLGHQAGDTLLCEISKRLRSCVRKSDTVARMGGDEFVVLLTDLRSANDAQEICHKLLSTVAQPIRIGRHDIIVTTSIGISLFPDCQDVDTLFKNADLAMYRVKAHGRNSSAVYTPSLEMQGLEQLQMESALRNALDAGEFEIVYQPQIAFADNRMIGVEALTRWHSREFGTVMPTVFIPLAEETGLIVPIGEWALVQACKEVAALQARLGMECTVAVNISPRQFQQKNFPATVELALRVSGLKPQQLELEITEQLLMVDSDESLEIMQRVRTLGVRFAIDDFGTGFSNMGYITRFAVDRIKIDRSFISRCDIDKNSHAVTQAIIALAHSLRIEVIAEGVESAQHVRALTELSCDQAQGYFYSRPLPLCELEAFALSPIHRFPGDSGGSGGGSPEVNTFSPRMSLASHLDA
ncbi:MAG TPA: EAL domain-containing protein [Edaphobacter sp.]|nr:EAL domain-containing protein [Edaphobacter sp.]